MKLLLQLTPQSEAQIHEIDSWWRKNRTSAPDLFLDELTAVFHLLASAPMLGRLYRASPVANVRRLLLRKTRYHLYYVVMPEAIRVLAIWHAQRGVGPPLRAH